MTKKRIFAVLFSVLAFAAVVGASLANASGGTPSTPAAVEDADSVDHQCPPDCTAADEADEATEVQGAEDADEVPAATEAIEGSGSEEAPGAEAAGDTHEDAGESADHRCPPDCDVANGEAP